MRHVIHLYIPETCHTPIRHVTRVHETCNTPIRHVTHTRDLSHTYTSCHHAYTRDMSHTYKSCHIYTQDMSHTSTLATSPPAHYPRARVIQHTRMRHVTRRNESCRTSACAYKKKRDTPHLLLHVKRPCGTCMNLLEFAHMLYNTCSLFMHLPMPQSQDQFFFIPLFCPAPKGLHSKRAAAEGL